MKHSFNMKNYADQQGVINDICIVLHITRQKNSKIAVLLFIKNTSKFLTSLLPHRLSSKHVFSFQILPRKQTKSIKKCCFQ